MMSGWVVLTAFCACARVRAGVWARVKSEWGVCVCESEGESEGGRVMMMNQ